MGVILLQGVITTTKLSTADIGDDDDDSMSSKYTTRIFMTLYDTSHKIDNGSLFYKMGSVLNVKICFYLSPH